IVMTGRRRPPDQPGEPGTSVDRRSSVYGVLVMWPRHPLRSRSPARTSQGRGRRLRAPDMAVDCGLRPDIAPQGWFDVVLVRPIFHGGAALSTRFSPPVVPARG